MNDKRYKITTAIRKFSADSLGYDYIKSDNQKFFARENVKDNWEEIKTLGKRTSALEWWDDNNWTFAIGSWVLYLIFILFFAEQIKESGAGILAIFLYPVLWLFPCALVNVLITEMLKIFQPYFVEMSYSAIQKLINSNKPYVAPTYYKSPSSSSRSYGGGSVGRGGGSGRYSSGGGASSYTPPLVLHTEMNNAIKTLGEKGTDWGTLANKKTLQEREKIFTEYFGDAEKGKFASEKFEREELSPARKRTLEKDIESGEYEEESIKESLKNKIKIFDGVISNDDFQKIFREIKTFQEKKRKIDIHTKYEGRLSNSDIKTIKAHLGYVCMGCKLDPAEEYGDEMAGIIEAHHKNPYSELADGETREVKPEDFLMLCPTCHKIIHKLSNPDDLDGLKTVLNKNKKSSWWS